MLGTVRPDSGRIRFRGRDLTDWLSKDARTYRRHVQGVFQQPLLSLDSRWRIGASIAEPLAIQRIGDKETRRIRVAELMRQVGLDAALAERRPHELSGGQLQRVNIARALALEPDLLVCDEPVSSLDVSIQAQVLDLLADLREHRALSLLFISHDLGVVRHMCERVVVMSRGEIVEAGETESVVGAPRDPYTRLLVDSALDPHVGPRQNRGKNT